MSIHVCIELFTLEHRHSLSRAVLVERRSSFKHVFATKTIYYGSLVLNPRIYDQSVEAFETACHPLVKQNPTMI